MELTTSQRRAIYEHDRNLVVVAGAGSGKTRVLVERYLALLDTHPEWPLNALVAITFTRKAAQEMRDRVRQTLSARYHEAADAEREVWAQRLASMDSARIDTIHGLCATILRANAAEAKVDPDFIVLDETEARILLDDVIDAALQTLVAENDPAVELFREYDSYSLQRSLTDLVATEITPLPVALFERWQTAWMEQAAFHVNRLRQNPVFIESANWMPETGWPDEDAQDKLLSVWLDCRLCLESLFSPVSDIEGCLEAVQQLAAGIKVNVGSAGNWGGKDGLAESKNHLKVTREHAQQLLKDIGERPGALDERAVQLLPLWHRLLTHIQHSFQQAKQAQGALDFNDLERLTRDLLVNYPAVRQRYQNLEFRHVLVDEFQDTNRAQWEIVQALADPQQAGSLFVVGDQKQSIYAFRGADVSVFAEVRRVLAGVGGDDAEVSLVRSFRTHRPLVDCFNHIFSQILVQDELSPVYDYETAFGEAMDAHRMEPPADLPPLELLLVDKASPHSDRSLSVEDCRRWEAYQIAQRLQQMVNEQTSVYDREEGRVRPLDYGDVALLFRSTTNFTLYEEVFKAAGLPFMTVAGRGYYDRPEVWDLLNLLQALYNPADDLSLASALRSPLFGLSDDALLALRLLRGEDGRRLPLWDALAQPERVPDAELPLVHFAHDCLTALSEIAGRVTISELLREALDRTHYLATLTGLPDGIRRRGNVEKLLEKAESSGRVTLGAFSAYLSDLSAREVREGEALLEAGNAVTLMTVHASKGLEFPVVVLVDSSWERRNITSSAVICDTDGQLACKVYDAEQDKLVPSFAYQRADSLSDLRDEAERKRLLYVAATRAQDYLLVSGQIEQKKNGEWKIEGWLRWLLQVLDVFGELETGGLHVLEREWGRLRLDVQQTPPNDDVYRVKENTESVWSTLRAGQLLPGDSQEPELLRPIVINQRDVARHLSVTQIADLGSVHYDGGEFYYQRFRRSVLDDAPARIASVTYVRDFKRLVGEIVHEALRWWRFPADTENLEELLQSYAWEQGIVDPQERQRAVNEALRLLLEFQASDVYGWVSTARRQFKELPFIFRSDKRIIHGVIDTLIEMDDSRWIIVDYKTSFVRAHPTFDDLQQHARRYHLQVGAYASATRAQLQQALKVDAVDIDVYIHYIRYQQTIPIDRADWEQALASLETLIGDVIG